MSFDNAILFLGVLVPLITALGAVLKVLYDRNKAKKELGLNELEFESLSKQRDVDSLEKVHNMFTELYDRQSKQIDDMDKKLKEISKLLDSYKLENMKLKRFIIEVFNTFEDKLLKLKTELATEGLSAKDCNILLEILSELLFQFKDSFYEEITKE